MPNMPIPATITLLMTHAEERDRTMRPMKINHLLTLFVVFAVSLFGQNRFTPARLTVDPAQEGFPTWSPDSKSIIYSNFSWTDSLGKNGLWRISLKEKQPRKIYSGIAEHPRLSPDGRLIVFDADTGNSMKMIDAEGGGQRKFLPDSIRIQSGGLPCWSPDGSQIAFKEGSTGSLWIYDMKTAAVSRIFREEGLLPLPGCWSGDGTYILIALMDRQTRKSTMWKISRDGKEKRQITGHHDAFYRYLALSPDESLLVYGALEGKDVGLWVMPFQGGKSVPLAVTHPGHNDGPAWSPDGKRLAFSSTRSGTHDIWVVDVDVDRLKEDLRTLNK